MATASRARHDMSLQDGASGVALWRQVADGIERGIAEGRFAGEASLVHADGREIGVAELFG